MGVYPAVASVAAVLGGRCVLGVEIQTMADLNRLVLRGLPFGSLRCVSAQFRTAHRARVEQVVVPRTTRLRRMQTGLLSPQESERLERVARVTAVAELVIGSQQGAHEFLTSAHALLDGTWPVDLAATDLGARRVADILWSLEYSLPM